MFDRGHIPDATTHLNGNEHCGGDFCDDTPVDGVTANGTVEVDNVQARSTLRLPLQRDLHRVTGKDSFLIIIAFIKTDATPVFKVNRRNYFDLSSASEEILKANDQIRNITNNQNPMYYPVRRLSSVSITSELAILIFQKW